MSSIFVVESFGVAADADEINLREAAWEFALDQRAFGPRRLLVAFGARDGRMVGLAHARRTNRPEFALAACIDHAGRGTALALAFCDERVVEGPPAPGLSERWALHRRIAQDFGVVLIDWFDCDDLCIRSTKLALHPDREWWDM